MSVQKTPQKRKTKRLKTEKLNFRPKTGTRAMLGWLSKQDNRSMTSWLENIVETLYKEKGGPPIEPEKKD
jgi:hypothetical protein